MPLEATVERLCRVSVDQFMDPSAGLEWPDAIDPDAWYTSPEYISLFGTPAYESLDVARRKRLSFFEAVNFFSLNIHGERMLIEGLARRLYRREQEGISPYLHHFLDEENKHMRYFGTFCTRYAGKVYAEKKLPFPQELVPGEEDFLFFAKVLVFEEIVDVYNRNMARDERLAAIVREIHRLHHFEEARHLVFGRELVAELFERHRPGWSGEVLERVRRTLAAYLGATWKEYYNPQVYADAGLDEAFELRRSALASPAARAHRAEVSQGCLRFLLQNGILEESPAL